ncbi:alpha-2-macroglobulin family domain-containing protein [Ditylenchus destructor]|nr:alpha-2-macroglobulin family domain-containing protein [Ditylenchus destructor]
MRKKVKYNNKGNIEYVCDLQLNDGIWEGTVNIADCVKSQEDPLPKIQLIADVNQRETYRPVSAIVEYDAYGSGFELIPLRPAYTEHTQKIFIYLNRLSYLPSILDDTVEVTDHCVSESKDANGKNRSIVGQKVGTIIDIDSKCKLYIIKARRKLMENVYSREELIVIPAIFNYAAYLGETIEANVPPDLHLNYLVVCNSKDVSSIGSVTPGSRIMVPVKPNMNGQCVLYVYTVKDGIFQLDMYLFMVLALNCPEDYSLKLSLQNITVFSPLDVRLQAKRGSWAIVHGFDSRLEGLLRISSGAAGSKHWAFNEFTKPDERSSDLVWLSNFLRLSDFIQALKTSCHAAGKYAPQCPKNNFSSSRVSDICLRELKSGCNPSLKSTGSLMDRMQKQDAVQVSTMFNMLQPARHQRPPPNAKSTKNVVEEDLMNDVEEQSEQDSSNLIIRDYFPEVWLFEDYKLGDSGILTIPLKSPHTVTEWKFHAAFWTKGRGGMCQSVVTLKKVFMDVDLPQFTYSNETVQVRVTVSADNIDSQTNMAVCFRGLSPVVCGDLGRDGTLGETDYTRILLNADQKIVVKSFYVRFLKEGLHNISFELREENAIPGGEWHCRDEDALIYDRILKQVQVNKRVDIEEHYRQFILYRTRKIDYPMQIARSMQPIVDVITQPDGSVLTTIELNSQEKVYNIDLEFAKYLPTISAYLGNDPDRSALSSPMSKYARYKRRRRFQKSVSDNDVSSSYSLSNVIKELASVTYDLKVLKTASRVIPANEIEARENEMGNLLSELLTFSDCHTQGKKCGFGEFTQPANPDQRNILLTSIATSLLCEQSAAEEYVCGPLLFLAEVANKLGLRETIDLGYSTQLYFDNEDDRILFLQALLVNMVNDCGIYSCVNATGAWIQLHSDFYKVDESKNYDMRTEAAMAFVSTPIVRALLRRKLATKARVDKLPFWNIAADKYSLNSLDRSLTKSANVLVNSLALLGLY